MPPPPPRKPAPPAAKPKPGESFIGNDSSTMMTEETFEEFEARMKAAEGAAGSMTFERYVEVMTAQSCWAQQGKDANQMLKKVFNMTAVDWSNASAYWAQKMSTDVVLMRDQFPVLSAKYTQKYMAGVDDPDADLDV